MNGNYFAWYYALGAGLINAIAHFTFPILAGGYFPGLYTAPIHLVRSIILIWELLRENRAVGESQRYGNGRDREPASGDSTAVCQC